MTWKHPVVFFFSYWSLKTILLAVKRKEGLKSVTVPFLCSGSLSLKCYFFSSTSHWSTAVLKGYRVTVDGECNFELLKNNDAKLLFESKRKEMAQMLEES